MVFCRKAFSPFHPYCSKISWSSAEDWKESAALHHPLPVTLNLFEGLTVFRSRSLNQIKTLKQVQGDGEERQTDAGAEGVQSTNRFWLTVWV
jgi:hypothetical protein